MSSFEASKSLFSQQHFTVVELDLPVVEGTCTISGQPGYGTPQSCDQPSNATKTYKFTDINAPILPESGILRVIKNIKETTAELRSGRGLASRGTVSITFVDKKGDPNPFAPAVTDQIKNTGTFFGKLSARNIFANRDVRVKNYRVEQDGSIDLINGAETRYYISESFVSLKNNEWQLKCKDELARINIGESVWPLPLEGSVRLDLDDTATVITVDANVNYLVGDALRVGDEFFKVDSVVDIGLPTAAVGVGTRGSPITYTNTLTTTIASAHDAGDEIFVCEVSDDERIDDLLERILIDVGVPSARIPKSDWTAEINEWHPLTRVNTLWYESLETNSVIEEILTSFLLDMWFDPVSREIKLEAISAWKESAATLKEGDQITFESVKRSSVESLRSTRAFIIYDKRNLATSDSIENYKKASIFKRTDLETGDFYGEPKTKQFESSKILSKDAADLLVQRFVQRYISPFLYSWETIEKKLNFNVGDVVDLDVSVAVGFDGANATSTRSQIISINPKYTNVGRVYDVKALTYEPVFATNSEIVITGNISNVNLYNQYAGAPPSAVTITFIFDGVVSSSSDENIPAIRAGGFAAGSKIIFVMTNGANLKAKGGDGGDGQTLIWDDETGSWIPGAANNGKKGAIVYDAEGVDTDIYFSGATPSAAHPTADGSIKAPSGGDGGFDGSYTPGVETGATSGNGGDGGNGSSIGLGGDAGQIIGTTGTMGTSGTPGLSDSGFGVAGANNNATGGAAGSGVIDNGATVVFFGSSPTRYVNGNGDH